MHASHFFCAACKQTCREIIFCSLKCSNTVFTASVSWQPNKQLAAVASLVPLSFLSDSVMLFCVAESPFKTWSCFLSHACTIPVLKHYTPLECSQSAHYMIWAAMNAVGVFIGRLNCLLSRFHFLIHFTFFASCLPACSTHLHVPSHRKDGFYCSPRTGGSFTIIHAVIVL